MNQLQHFDFKGRQVRTVVVDNEPMFVGKDIAEVLGYSKPANAVNKYVPDKFKGVTKLMTPGGKQDFVIVSEAGLYKLVFKSGMPNADEFTDWVAAEVLPSIRKHGAYMTPETIEKAIYNPDFIINLATKLKEERTGRLIAEQRVNELQPKADYYDLILANKGLVTTTSIAKNYGMSASAFNQLLHSLGIQFNQSGSWYLYSKYQNHGYTHTVPVAFKHRDGRDDVKPNTKWTQKGHVFLYEELKKNDVIPVIEQKGMTV
ncbi:MAG: phage antirepressor [Lacticaseibacillus paracasei]|jgi:prophage antirepressor-like protein|nr:phage antirepressor [Lacticaseibacillus paracasei]MCH4042809.1 phage antirepressor [Lacticaseibacillus paracasei]MCH4117493.1 phage antirepressor [Lacticaseibacillus paracasei]MCI1356199.1 phage antirepressor [Lacticaseibacillus paracasei]MCI1377068.1 phage antirepressor [Lacticaseibacillus paracasei]